MLPFLIFIGSSFVLNLITLEDRLEDLLNKNLEINLLFSKIEPTINQFIFEYLKWKKKPATISDIKEAIEASNIVNKEFLIKTLNCSSKYISRLNYLIKGKYLKGEGFIYYNFGPNYVFKRDGAFYLARWLVKKPKSKSRKLRSP